MSRLRIYASDILRKRYRLIAQCPSKYHHGYEYQNTFSSAATFFFRKSSVTVRNKNVTLRSDLLKILYGGFDPKIFLHRNVFFIIY